jgi:hypothetical protein
MDNVLGRLSDTMTKEMEFVLDRPDLTGVLYVFREFDGVLRRPKG